MVRAVARVSRGINLGQGAACFDRERTLRTGLVGFHSLISHRLASLVFSTETRCGAEIRSLEIEILVGCFCKFAKALCPPSSMPRMGQTGTTNRPFPDRTLDLFTIFSRVRSPALHEHFTTNGPFGRLERDWLRFAKSSR